MIVAPDALGPNPTNDAAKRHDLCVPIVQLLAAPWYLFDKVDAIDKVDRDRLVPIGGAVIDIVASTMGISASPVTAPDSGHRSHPDQAGRQDKHGHDVATSFGHPAGNRCRGTSHGRRPRRLRRRLRFEDRDYDHRHMFRRFHRGVGQPLVVEAGWRSNRLA